MNTKVVIDDVSNEMYNLLKWLRTNVSTDKLRENWHGIHIKNNRTIFEATNGFQAVVARLPQPIFHENLVDGTWRISTLTKKIIVLEKMDVNYPDLDLILTDYDKPIPDTQTFLSVNPAYLCSAIAGFDKVDINFVTSNRPIQISLHSNDMPVGTYVAIVMPYRSDASFTTIQTDIKAVKVS